MGEQSLASVRTLAGPQSTAQPAQCRVWPGLTEDWSRTSVMTRPGTQ